MDALTYFFFNLGLLNILLALISFILGLLLGWLLWGKLKGQINSYITQQNKDQSEINSLRSRNQAMSAQLAKTTSNDSLKDEYDQCKSRRLKLEAEQKDDHSLIADLRSQLEECEASSNDNSSAEELAACQQKCASLEEERSELQSKMASQSFSASAASIPVAAALTPAPSAPATNAKSRDFFASDISSGKMVEDEKYGLLYNSAPDEVDDLTKIKGVAGVLNKTLNDYGVFTYRQIAIWSPQICEDFSDKISFRGRIERDNWISQCKGFHQEKYGESI